MTPEQKAIALVDKFTIDTTPFSEIGTFSKNQGKQCALVCVEEIWSTLESERVFEQYDYWQQVKTEINKL